MSEKWEDKGHHTPIPILSDISEMVFGHERRHVVNTDTGEE
jgi:hypothetical protein